MKKLKISIFTGGSGNSELIKILGNNKNIQINLLINGYDDGKSTKYIRDTFPNMLGPSDFRKNTLNLLDERNNNFIPFKFILNHRFKNYSEFLIFQKELGLNSFEKFKILNNLSFDKIDEFKKFFILLKKIIFNIKEFNDISLGNLFFSSFFFKYKNFNLSLEKFTNFFDINGNILNITDGKNLYLHTLTSSGEIINEEADIIENKNKYTFDELYLFKKKIKKSFLKKLCKKNIHYKKKYLEKLNYTPVANKSALNIIKQSDIIIYGPGTQFSSLFPSYMTKSVGEAINSSKAKKFLILNIFKDNDICNQTQKDILSKFEYFLSTKKKNNYKKLYDYIMSHRIDEEDINNLNFRKYLFNDLKNKRKNIIYLDWEKSSGKHLPNLLIKNILKFSNKNFSSFNFISNTVSIVLPCLNEEKKLKKVLKKINNLNISKNLFLEFIFVDGGSSDKSLDIARKFKKFKIYSLKNRGRGFAINYGIMKSKGDIIAVFPTDDEYSVLDLEKMIENILNNNEKVIYGSRIIKCTNLSNQIKKVYKENYFGYIISKYGGLFISICTLLLYNRFITDPFTSLKIFRSNIIKNLKIYSTGVDYDIEQCIRLIEKNIYINEYPVKFVGRNYSNGKKITILDGLNCLFRLFKLKFT